MKTKPLHFASLLLWTGAAASAQAATPSPAPIEGVWKITAPAVTLKPLAGAVPFTAEGRKAYDANKKLKAQRKFDDYDITTSRCSTPGIPRLMLTPMRFKIWVRQNVATFDFEWNRAIRQIDMRSVETEAPLVPNMAGVSKGKWEGDTLVAITSDISDRTLIDDLVPHSDALKVTERFRLIDADTLEVRITIEDSTYFTKPWEAVLTYKRQPMTLWAEDICLERIKAGKPAIPAR